MCIKHVMAVKDLHVTMAVVPQPSKWFALQSYVSDSLASKTLCIISGGNFGLGNSFLNKFNKKCYACPFWATHGVSVRLRISYVLFVCLAVKRMQVSLGLSDFRNQAVMSGKVC